MRFEHAAFPAAPFPRLFIRSSRATIILFVSHRRYVADDAASARQWRRRQSALHLLPARRRADHCPATAPMVASRAVCFTVGSGLSRRVSRRRTSWTRRCCCRRRETGAGELCSSPVGARRRELAARSATLTRLRSRTPSAAIVGLRLRRNPGRSSTHRRSADAFRARATRRPAFPTRARVGGNPIESGA